MWRDWRAIRKKERAWRKLKAAYDHDIKKAERKGLSRDDIRSIESEAFHFIGEAWHERNLAITAALLREASHLNVYRPEWGDSEMWEEPGAYDSRRCLNAKGTAAVRQAIRAEREARTSYLRIFTAVCSFISAVAAITAAAAALLGVLSR